MTKDTTQGQSGASNVVSFDDARGVRYIQRALSGFFDDPADGDFQRGFLSALLTVYGEGLGKGFADDRLAILRAQVGEDGSAAE